MMAPPLAPAPVRLLWLAAVEALLALMAPACLEMVPSAPVRLLWLAVVEALLASMAPACSEIVLFFW